MAFRHLPGWTGFAQASQAVGSVQLLLVMASLALGGHDGSGYAQRAIGLLASAWMITLAVRTLRQPHTPLPSSADEPPQPGSTRVPAQGPRLCSAQRAGSAEATVTAATARYRRGLPAEGRRKDSGRTAEGRRTVTGRPIACDAGHRNGCGRGTR